MQKRFLFIVIIGVITTIATGGFIIARNRKAMAPELFVQQISPSPTLIPTPAGKLLTWDDPAGFSFQYPDGITVNPHQEDNDNYAHVELTSIDHPGSLIVWAKDTNSADVTAWVRTEKAFAGSPVIDTTLGGKPAKKISLSVPDKLETGTIDDSLLFLVDSTVTDKSYWTGIHTTVTDSFTFKPEAGSGAPPGPGGGAADEEETVQ